MAPARLQVRTPGRRAAGWGSGAGWPGRAQAAAAAATRCCRAWGCTWTPWSRRPQTSSAPHPFWRPPRPPHPWRWPHAPVCGTWPGGSGTRPAGTGAGQPGAGGRGETSFRRGLVRIITSLLSLDPLHHSARCPPRLSPPSPPRLSPPFPPPLAPSSRSLGSSPWDLLTRGSRCLPVFSVSRRELRLRSPHHPKPSPQFFPTRSSGSPPGASRGSGERVRALGEPFVQGLQ